MEKSQEIKIIPGGTFSWRIPVEWDILAAASTSWLSEIKKTRFVEEKAREKSHSVTVLGNSWQLWNYELGEMGTLYIRKISLERSEIFFSGIGFQGLMSDEMWEIKKRHMMDIIKSYFFWLEKEKIISAPK